MSRFVCVFFNILFTFVAIAKHRISTYKSKRDFIVFTPPPTTTPPHHIYRCRDFFFLIFVNRCFLKLYVSLLGTRKKKTTFFGNIKYTLGYEQSLFYTKVINLKNRCRKYAHRLLRYHTINVTATREIRVIRKPTSTSPIATGFGNLFLAV